MTNEDLKRSLDSLAGEAIFSSLLVAALIEKLILKGVFERQEMIEMIDRTLMVAEKRRTDPQGPGPGAIDHTRIRLEGLLRGIASKPDR